MKIVFDIGGTNTRIARVQGDSIGDVQKFPTPAQPAEAVTKIGEAARSLAGTEALETVAGGVAGVIKDNTVVHSPNLPAWDNFVLGKELESALKTKITLCNDADAAALGEATRGAGKGFHIVAYVCVGTGVGGGRVVDGKIDAFAYGFEPGQQIFDSANNTTLEAMVSGGAIWREFNKYPRQLPEEAYKSRITVLAVALHNIIMLWSPDMLVLGGGAINETDGYKIADIKTALEKVPSIFPKLPEVRASALGDTAGLHGALELLTYT